MFNRRMLIRINEHIYLRKQRKKNKNLNPTIVSNNCIGGIIYHNLGLKFLSPTINLFFSQEQYYVFVKNFKYYMSCELIEKISEHREYPVGVIKSRDYDLPDIDVFFQHYTSFEDAKIKWDERKQRINYNNVYFIWEYYETLCDYKWVKEFDILPIKKMIITHREIEGISNAQIVSCYTNDEPIAKILQYNGLSGKRYLEEVDYIGFLND